MKKPAPTKPQHIFENDSDAMKSARCNRLPVQTVLVGTSVFVINKTRMHSSRMRTVRWLGRVTQLDVCQTLPVKRMTDACENISLPQLRCGR